MLTYATSNPAAAPLAVPINRQMMIAPGMGMPFTIIQAANTLTNPATDPTDKSMPPVMMTIVIPTEIMPVMETCFRIVKNVLDEKKRGDITVNSMIKNSRTNTIT